MSEHAEQLMGRCLELARTAAGRTSPNPMVGCVVVKDGVVVGEGFHPGIGLPHAEVFALKEAGDRAFGATLYVNLEPCNHYGRTPPCCDAILAAGIAKVVVGMVDPDPRVSGSGIARLREAGLEVIVGVSEKASRVLNEAFIHRILHQKPFGILKYAMTLDGKIATDSGHSAWVTGSRSRQYVHLLRSKSDAIVIGGNTLRRDNPFLTTHGIAGHNPLRVVISRSFDLPLSANLWDVTNAPTLVFTEVSTNPTQLLQISKVRDLGVEVLALENLGLTAAMQVLFERGISQVFWECGGTLAAGAIASGLIQKVFAFIAPKIIGGQTAPTPVGDLGKMKMTEAIELVDATIQQIDSDFVIEGYLS